MAYLDYIKTPDFASLGEQGQKDFINFAFKESVKTNDSEQAKEYRDIALKHFDLTQKLNSAESEHDKFILKAQRAPLTAYLDIQDRRMLGLDTKDAEESYKSQIENYQSQLNEDFLADTTNKAAAKSMSEVIGAVADPSRVFNSRAENLTGFDRKASESTTNAVADFFSDKDANKLTMEALDASDGDIDKAINFISKDVAKQQKQRSTALYSEGLDLESLPNQDTTYSGTAIESLQKMKEGLDKLNLSPEDKKAAVKDTFKTLAWSEDDNSVRKLSTGELAFNPSSILGNVSKDDLIAKIDASDASEGAKRRAKFNLEDARRDAAKDGLARIYRNEMMSFAKTDIADIEAQLGEDAKDPVKVMDAYMDANKDLKGAIGNAKGVADFIWDVTSSAVMRTVAGIRTTDAVIAQKIGLGDTAAGQRAAEEANYLSQRNKDTDFQAGILSSGTGETLSREGGISLVQIAPMVLGGGLVAASKLTGAAATAANAGIMVGTAGVQGFDSVVQGALERKRQELGGGALTTKEAMDVFKDDSVVGAAVANGAFNVATSYLFPKGAESFNNNLTAREFLSALKEKGKEGLVDVTKKFIRGIPSGAVDEGMEEMVQNLGEEYINRVILHAEKNPDELVSDTFQQGAMGAAIGAGVNKFAYNRVSHWQDVKERARAVVAAANTAEEASKGVEIMKYADNEIGKLVNATPPYDAEQAPNMDSEVLKGFADNAVSEMIAASADDATGEVKPTEVAPAEPLAAEPLAAEPIPTEPLAAEPLAAEPLAAEPIPTEPVAAEPTTPTQKSEFQKVLDSVPDTKTPLTESVKPEGEDANLAESTVKNLQKKIVWFSGDSDFNGFVDINDPDNIYINKEATSPVAEVFKHEFTHSIEGEMGDGKFGEFANALKPLRPELWSQMLAQNKNNVKLATQEFVANAVGKSNLSLKFLDEVFSANMTTATKKSFFTTLVDSIRSFIKGIPNGKQKTKLDEVATVAEKYIKELAANRQNKQTAKPEQATTAEPDNTVKSKKTKQQLTKEINNEIANISNVADQYAKDSIVSPSADPIDKEFASEARKEMLKLRGNISAWKSGLSKAKSVSDLNQLLDDVKNSRTPKKGDQRDFRYLKNQQIYGRDSGIKPNSVSTPLEVIDALQELASDERIDISWTHDTDKARKLRAGEISVFRNSLSESNQKAFSSEHLESTFKAFIGLKVASKLSRYQRAALLRKIISNEDVRRAAQILNFQKNVTDRFGQELGDLFMLQTEKMAKDTAIGYAVDTFNMPRAEAEAFVEKVRDVGDEAAQEASEEVNDSAASIADELSINTDSTKKEVFKILERLRTIVNDLLSDDTELSTELDSFLEEVDSAKINYSKAYRTPLEKITAIAMNDNLAPEVRAKAQELLDKTLGQLEKKTKALTERDKRLIRGIKTVTKSKGLRAAIDIAQDALDDSGNINPTSKLGKALKAMQDEIAEGTLAAENIGKRIKEVLSEAGLKQAQLEVVAKNINERAKVTSKARARKAVKDAYDEADQAFNGKRNTEPKDALETVKEMKARKEEAVARDNTFRQFVRKLLRKDPADLEDVDNRQEFINELTKLAADKFTGDMDEVFDSILEGAKANAEIAKQKGSDTEKIKKQEANTKSMMETVDAALARVGRSKKHVFTFEGYVGNLLRSSQENLTTNKEKIMDELSALAGKKSTAEVEEVYNRIVEEAGKLSAKRGEETFNGKVREAAQGIMSQLNSNMVLPNVDISVFDLASSLADVRTLLGTAFDADPNTTEINKHAAKIWDAKRKFDAIDSTTTKMHEILIKNPLINHDELRFALIKHITDLDWRRRTANKNAVQQDEKAMINAVEKILSERSLSRVSKRITQDIVTNMVNGGTAFSTDKAKTEHFKNVMMSVLGYTDAEATSKLNSTMSDSRTFNQHMLESVGRYQKRVRMAQAEKVKEMLNDGSIGAKATEFAQKLVGALDGGSEFMPALFEAAGMPEKAMDADSFALLSEASRIYADNPNPVIRAVAHTAMQRLIAGFDNTGRTKKRLDITSNMFYGNMFVRASTNSLQIKSNLLTVATDALSDVIISFTKANPTDSLRVLNSYRRSFGYAFAVAKAAMLNNIAIHGRGYDISANDAVNATHELSAIEKAYYSMDARDSKHIIKAKMLLGSTFTWHRIVAFADSYTSALTNAVATQNEAFYRMRQNKVNKDDIKMLEAKWLSKKSVKDIITSGAVAEARFGEDNADMINISTSFTGDNFVSKSMRKLLNSADRLEMAAAYAASYERFLLEAVALGHLSAEQADNIKTSARTEGARAIGAVGDNSDKTVMGTIGKLSRAAGSAVNNFFDSGAEKIDREFRAGDLTKPEKVLNQVMSIGIVPVFMLAKTQAVSALGFINVITRLTDSFLWAMPYWGEVRIYSYKKAKRRGEENPFAYSAATDYAYLRRKILSRVSSAVFTAVLGALLFDDEDDKALKDKKYYFSPPFPKDKAEANEWKERGIKPNSLNINDGTGLFTALSSDRSFSQLKPFFVMAATVTTMKHIWKTTKDTKELKSILLDESAAIITSAIALSPVGQNHFDKMANLHDSKNKMVDYVFQPMERLGKSFLPWVGAGIVAELDKSVGDAGYTKSGKAAVSSFIPAVPTLTAIFADKDKPLLDNLGLPVASFDDFKHVLWGAPSRNELRRACMDANYYPSAPDTQEIQSSVGARLGIPEKLRSQIVISDGEKYNYLAEKGRNSAKNFSRERASKMQGDDLSGYLRKLTKDAAAKAADSLAERIKSKNAKLIK